MAYSDEDLSNMTDEELSAAFREAKAQGDSPETDYENEADVGEEELDLEQPDEESDYETSSDDEDGVDLEEDSEATEGEPDEETEDEDEKPTEKETKSEVEEQPAQRRKYKANGKDYEFSDDEIFEQFGQVFGQAMNYTQKMQQMKPWRKTIDAIEQAGLTDNDVSLAIDVLKGDKEAIASLLRRTGVDALEIDTDNVNYQPRDYGRNDTELAIKDIVDEIKGDAEYSTTYDVLENKWDARSRNAFAENPEMIRQLHIDVKSGMFETIVPLMNKMRVYDGGGKSDLDYYKMAAQQYFAQASQEEARLNATEKAQTERSNVERVKTDMQRREATTKASVKRKAATPTTKSAGSKSVDYLSDSDSKFEDWYNKLQDSL